MSNRLKIYGCYGVEHSGVGSLGFDWTTNDVLNKYLPNGAAYFLYTFIPKSDIYKYPKIVREKRKKQLEVKDYIAGIYVPNYGSEYELDQLLRENTVSSFNAEMEKQGFKKRFESVEEILEALKKGEVAGVGEPISMAIAMIIVALISLVTGVLVAVIDYCLSKKELEMQADAQAHYVVPTEETIKESVFGAEDFDDFQGTKTSTASTKWLPLLLLPTALVLLSKK